MVACLNLATIQQEQQSKNVNDWLSKISYSLYTDTQQIKSLLELSEDAMINKESLCKNYTEQDIVNLIGILISKTKSIQNHLHELDELQLKM